MSLMNRSGKPVGVLYFYHWGFVVSPIRQALDEFCVLFMGEYSVEWCKEDKG